jgi:hypothetical protein
MEQIPLASDVCNIITQFLPCLGPLCLMQFIRFTPISAISTQTLSGSLIAWLIDRLNEYDVEGARELYEVIE